MTRIMRDSDTPTAIRIHGADIVAGYVTGGAKWPAKAYARFRRMPVAHIDCRGTMPKKAEILDVEEGCASIHTAVTWVKKRKAAFPGAYPPIIYCNRSTLAPLHHAMKVAGLRLVKDFRLWVTTLDGTKRLDDMTGVMAVQYAGEDMTGGHYDESIVYDDDWHPEDDMPYSKKRIRKLVEQGVRAELKQGQKGHKELADLVVKVVTNELNDPNTKIAKDLHELLRRVPAPPPTPTEAGDGSAVTAGVDGAPQPA
jgi:hypothetical protein